MSPVTPEQYLSTIYALVANNETQEAISCFLEVSDIFLTKEELDEFFKKLDFSKLCIVSIRSAFCSLNQYMDSPELILPYYELIYPRAIQELEAKNADPKHKEYIDNALRMIKNISPEEKGWARSLRNLTGK